ncbi:MAG TPA: N-acetylglucosamine-6-phosphate deacetylase [Anaerolineaceae bacterium]|nr:N-acetylglucosamine-6-phosphate deacetylase [Anaerolineaceae bacterium]
MIGFENVTILTPERTIDGGALLVRDGRIRALGRRDAVELPAGAQRIDGQGNLLVPGFIELQINGGFGMDFTERPETIWPVAERLPAYGVTSFLPTVITNPMATFQQAIEVIQAGEPVNFRGARPLGLHIEGPFLNQGKKGAHNPAYIRPPDLEATATWSRDNGVRLVTLAPEQPGAIELIRALVARGVVVSAGHSLATYEQAEQAFSAGVTYGTHLYNAQPPLDHRKPGLSAALLTDPGVVFGMIVDGVHVHPAMVDLAWKAKGPDGITLVTDAMAALGMPPGTYPLGDHEVVVDGTSAWLADHSSLAGSILTHDSALRNLMAFTGCTLGEALLTLTRTPARVLGLTDRGRMASGAIADLVLLSPDGRVLMTVAAGEVVYNAGR